MDTDSLITKETEYEKINLLYDECLNYLKTVKDAYHEKYAKFLLENDADEIPDIDFSCSDDPKYDTINEINNSIDNTKIHGEINAAPKANLDKSDFEVEKLPKTDIQFENELKTDSTSSLPELKSDRLRRLSQQLPKIVITQTQSASSLNAKKQDTNPNTTYKISDENLTERKLDTISEPILPQHNPDSKISEPKYRLSSGCVYPQRKPAHFGCHRRPPSPFRIKAICNDFPKRLVSKSGYENVALITNVPFEKIRLLNDTFHTLINLRWRWIILGTIVVHFAIWLVFAVFWYVTALAHYDFEPNPPARTCVTGGKDFVTIFLASVEAQTTIGFGDRAIDEECPESIFLFIMQLILGTGLSGVLTCVVYAKLTRPEKLSRDGVGFSKRAVICLRDGRLCLMIRAWDLNYDHIIGSEFTAHFVDTHRTKEGEQIRYYARILPLQQRQFLLWPVTLVHIIDATSPLYHYTPDMISNFSYEITLSLKGASASMGTFTQSQTSYNPKEITWGYRFPPVVKYDHIKQKYVIDHKKLNVIEPVDTPYCSAAQLYNRTKEGQKLTIPKSPSTRSFSEKISSFVQGRSSSFRRSTSRQDDTKPSTPTPSSDFGEKMISFSVEKASSFRKKN